MKPKTKALFTIQDLRLNYLHITNDDWAHEFAVARILGVPHSEIYRDCTRAKKVGKMADKLRGGGKSVYTNCVYWEEL